jgi:DMSO reductase family type II enzyme heme b subunit
MKRSVTCLVLALMVLGGCARRPAQDTEQVAAKFTSAPLPFEDPASPLWDQAAEHVVALLKQDLVEPKLLEPGVELVTVRALHNDEWVVFRLEWADPTEDLIPHTGRSSDAAAIQFPHAGDRSLPEAAMGESGGSVRIWYWKAVWQDDAARARAGGEDRIATLYPNAAIDHYPYEANPQARAEMERRYAPARAAGNPITTKSLEAPVQVLTAEGFGNTRPAAAQPARGGGRWTRGTWRVTIARPLRGGEELGDLVAGKRSYLALAIWDGAQAHTGSRKMRSEWTPLVLEKQ